MKIINIGSQNSILNHFIQEIRDVSVQKDSLRFRRNIERIGEVFAYEISKKLTYIDREITTPLGISKERLIESKPVLSTILRAGLPLHQGLLNYFDQAENAFISAYRKHTTKIDFDVHIEYLSSPDINNREVILCDPMLASGSSMILALKALKTKGIPKHVHIVSVIASSKGLDYIKNNICINNYTVWIGAEDKEMTKESYIVPGLGDAGDLAFGQKKD